MAKKSASWKDYLIDIDEKNAVKVYKSGTLCENTMATLREIAQAVGFELEKKWNTQQSGVKLVKFLADSMSEAIEPQEKKVEKVQPEVTQVPVVDSKYVEHVDEKPQNKKEKNPREKAKDGTLFRDGDSLHQTDAPAKAIESLNERTHQLPAAIHIIASDIEGCGSDGFITEFEGTFLHFNTVLKESPELRFTHDPNGASSYKNYQYWSSGVVSVPTVIGKKKNKSKKGEDGKNAEEIVLLGTVKNQSCSLTQDCSDCSGSGKCTYCKGKGIAECSDCGGNGKCRVCSGRGKVECPDCNGSGQCIHCKGNGFRYECPDCGGTGKVKDGLIISRNVKCKRCGGSGRFYHRCEWCDGSGKCAACNSRGRVVCPTCEGNKLCKNCQGSKVMKCTQCNGSKKCTACTGTGKQICQRCNGTGNYQTYSALNIESFIEKKTHVNCTLKIIQNQINGGIPHYDAKDCVCSWEHKNSDYKDSVSFNTACYSDVLSNALSSLQINAIENLPATIAAELVEDEKTISSGNDAYAKDLVAKTYGFPISSYKFQFEGKEYSFLLAGRNSTQIIGSFPSKHFFEGLSFESKGFFSSIKKGVTGFLKSDNAQRNEIIKALVLIAQRITQHLGNVDNLLEEFDLYSQMEDAKSVQRVSDIIEKGLSDKDFYKEISCLNGFAAAAVWAFIFADGNPIYKEIASHLGIQDKDFFNKVETYYGANPWRSISPKELLSLFGKQFLAPEK